MFILSLGNEPFVTNIEGTKYITICNGEIYNWKELAKQYNFQQHLTSTCDTEILSHLLHRQGLEKTCAILDGIFAFCVINQNTQTVFVGRDTFGVCPIYYAHREQEIIFSSMLKGIPSHLRQYAFQFPPSHCAKWSYANPVDFISTPVTPIRWNTLLEDAKSMDKIQFTDDKGLDYHAHHIKKLLIEAVSKRFMSDRPICCLLSGGLDSSLITSIFCRLSPPGHKVKTFSIGLPGSRDLGYARKVADFLGTDHHEIIVPKESMIEAIPNTIYEVEMFDPLTIRSSAPNLLLSKYIADNTDCRVVFTGEGSDEVFNGYLFAKKTPSSFEFHMNAVQLLESIQFYAVLRADRCNSSNGLEARVPFLDKKLVEYVLLHTPIKYRQHPTIEKHILRYAFDDQENPFLPQEVLWREKEAFSDGVGSDNDPWGASIQSHVLKRDRHVKKLNNDKYMPDSDHAFGVEEVAWYQHIFQNHFKNCEKVIPELWKAKW